jgi:hypothetical protein
MKYIQHPIRSRSWWAVDVNGDLVDLQDYDQRLEEGLAFLGKGPAYLVFAPLPLEY